jgi:hypothetical protein
MALLMAFVVLFSTMSFSIDMHYCGGALVNTAFFKKAQTCGMEMQTETTSSDRSLVGKSCCRDEKIVVKGQKELTVTYNNLELHHQVFLASFAYSYINFYNDLSQKVTPFDDYPPPLIVKDIHKIDEVYLI